MLQAYIYEFETQEILYSLLWVGLAIALVAALFYVAREIRAENLELAESQHEITSTQFLREDPLASRFEKVWKPEETKPPVLTLGQRWNQFWKKPSQSK